FIGHDEVANEFGRLGEALMRWPHKFEVLPDHALRIAAALQSVATDAADEAQVIAGVDKDREGKGRLKIWIGGQMHALNDHDWPRLDVVAGALSPVVNGEVVNRLVDAFAAPQRLDVLAKEGHVLRGRIVEIDRRLNPVIGPADHRRDVAVSRQVIIVLGY